MLPSIHNLDWHLGLGAGTVVLALLFSIPKAAAQEMEPRAYSVSPKGTNFLVVALGRSSGDLSFDAALPILDAKTTLYATVLGYGREIDFAGRSASVTVVAPYIWGTLEGVVAGNYLQARRSGLEDPSFRFAVNLHGAPTMDLDKFREYRQTTNIGASLVVTAPLGQYDPGRYVNIGSHRWAVKPELGLSRRVGRWYLDLYLGTWFYTANTDYLGKVRTQDPLGSAQVHVSYNVNRRIWAALDTNFYTGGRTSVGSDVHADLQRNSRVGATLSLRVTGRQSLKFSGSTGARTNIGAAFSSVGVAYQFMWGARL
jgi:hypothetical protein